MSRSQNRSQEITSGQLEQKSVELINYLLQRSCSFLPIKITDMMPFADNQRSTLKLILPNVTDELRKTYGIEFREIPEVSRGAGKRFICTATSAPASLFELTPRQRKQRTLLWIVLSYIFMRTPSVTETQLQTYLAALKIDFGEHPYFGNVKKLLEETFVKQLYLQREKVNSTTQDEPKIVYSWGPRADIEFSKKNMLNDAAELMNRPTKFFMQQYNIAEEEVQDDEEMDESES